MRLAATHPECVRTLTLMESGAYQLLQEAGRDDLWLDFQRVMDAFRLAVAEGDPDTAWALFFDAYCSHVGPWRALPEATREAIKKKTPAQLRVYGAQASNPTRLSHIRQLACPTLVIHGQTSQAPERAVCELIAAHAPLGRIAEVPEAGHMAPLTHAQAVAEVLRAHIGRRGGAVIKNAASQQPFLYDVRHASPLPPHRRSPSRTSPSLVAVSCARG